MHEEDAALKKRRTDAWNSAFSNIVEVHHSSDFSEASSLDDSEQWQERHYTVSLKPKPIPKKEDSTGEKKDENSQTSLDRSASLATSTPPPPDLARRNNYRNTDPGAIPMDGEISPQTSERTIQIGDMEDKDPSDILMDAVLVDESQEHRMAAMAQETVTAVPMPEEEDNSKAMWLIFRNRRAASVVVLLVIISTSLAAGLSILFLSNDSEGPREEIPSPSVFSETVSSNPTSAPSMAPTVSVSTLAGLLRDSVADTAPWENTTSPQYRALNWLANEDVWISASIENGNFTIPIQIVVERYALVVLYMAWNGDLWTSATGMLNESLASCEWSIEVSCDDDDDFLNLGSPANRCKPTGVECNGSFVVGVSLTAIGAMGEIPTEVGLLSSLEYLLLGYNSLSGTLTTELFQLTKLEQLDLLLNDITGPIPSEVGLAANLRTLDLGYNKITGILDNVVNPSLRHIVFAFNDLEGTIPIDFGTMTMLEYLDLSSNDLSGQLPSSLADMHFLDHLSLEDNGALSGTVPAMLSSLNVSVLHLEGTDLRNVEVFCSSFPIDSFWADCGDPDIDCSCCTVCCESNASCLNGLGRFAWAMQRRGDGLQVASAI
eukprot:scaffold6440_cov124-Cylindrotheca_fusiformis.AAC.3